MRRGQEPQAPSVQRSLRSMQTIQKQLEENSNVRRPVLTDVQRTKIGHIIQEATRLLESGDVSAAIRALAGEERIVKPS